MPDGNRESMFLNGEMFFITPEIIFNVLILLPLLFLLTEVDPGDLRSFQVKF
jgi:hypothetical protein